jgi:sigma-E factor negative regulatory protein RseB
VSRWRAAAVLCLAAGTAAPLYAQSNDALTWLRRMQDATRKLSYSGTFVYQHGGKTETSRITRLASADTEKLEVLDGMPRELVRTRETVRCYLPESKVLKVEQRTAERTFPALLPEQLSDLSRNYDISLGETRRISDFDCQAVVLTPKDNLRYGYRLYADTRSGMLIRAVTFDAPGDPVEQFMFMQLRIGDVTPHMVKSRYDPAGWRVDDAATAPARLAGWSLNEDLPGFHKVVELTRRMGESKPVGQLVYSDGLAAVSVFIEPLSGRGEPPRTGLASLGAIHIYTREVANHMVTVVGEAPAASVQRFANAVQYRRP